MEVNAHFAGKAELYDRPYQIILVLLVMSTALFAMALRQFERSYIHVSA